MLTPAAREVSPALRLDSRREGWGWVEWGGVDTGEEAGTVHVSTPSPGAEREAGDSVPRSHRYLSLHGAHLINETPDRYTSPQRCRQSPGTPDT